MSLSQDTWIAADALHVVVRSEGPAVFDTKGRMVEKKKRRVFADFERMMAPQWVRELEAAKSLQMNSRPENMARENWLCFYSLDGATQRHGWTEEEQEAIRERLNGTAGAVRVEQPRLAAPWPAYDKLTVVGRRTAEIVAEKIAETVKELELDPAYVVAYEEQNENREAVIAAVRATVPVEEEPEPLIAA
jgi:hypothetical protein